MDEVFAKAAGRLAHHPMLGRASIVEGTRELLAHRSYRLIYEVGPDAVWVLGLLHTARLWPPARD